jgi:hypothetical protein
VRGDSRRDLYAKTLALCGLGVLAGAGAVVDYWPVGVRFPAIAPLMDQRAPLVQPIMQSADFQPIESSGALIAEAPLRGRPPVSSSEPAVVYASLPAMGAFSSAFGQAVELNRLPVPEFRAVTRDMPAMHQVYPALPSPGLQLLADRTSSGPADSSDDGFLTGAFKRTGTSIVKTSMKTGVSIFDAVRVVGSAVRRAMPD